MQHVYRNLVIGLCFLLHLNVQAADTGPRVFKIDTDNVVGETRESSKDPIVVIDPESGARCMMEVRYHEEHRAPVHYRGWYVKFSFNHPKEDEKSPERTIDVFWDGKAFPSPFTPGFKSNYTFLDPFADFPNRYEMKFEKSTRTLGFGGTSSSGLVIPQYELKLNEDHSAVEWLHYKLTVLGSVNTDITCKQTAKIETNR